MVKRIVKTLTSYAAESDLVSLLVSRKAAQYWPPPQGGMGYERESRFAFLPNEEYHTLPYHNQPFQATAKIELHEARRAGTHLDFRVIIPDRWFSSARVYDFAVVQRTDFPQTTGVYYRCVRRPHHSLDYFWTDSWTFAPGEYGEGEMTTVYRGEIDVLSTSPEKIEFYIPDSRFKGYYCLFTERADEFGDSAILLRMKEPPAFHKERMAYSSNPNHISTAHESSRWIAELKIDGAHFMLVPGAKVNQLISRRLSVTGQPIDRADWIPALKYYKFPTELHGRILHCEVFLEDNSRLLGHATSNQTAGVLNSGIQRARQLQQNGGQKLRVSILDIDGPQTYEHRRHQYIDISKSTHIDNRRWSEFRDRFIFRRWLQQPTLQYPFSNEDLMMSTTEFRDLVEAWEGEGIVLKHLDGYYYIDLHIKDKNSITRPVKIVGFQEGEERLQGSLGALIVEDLETGVRSKLGTGLTDLQRRKIWDNQDQLIGHEFTAKAHETTPNGVLRGPSFVPKINPSTTALLEIL